METAWKVAKFAFAVGLGQWAGDTIADKAGASNPWIQWGIASGVTYGVAHALGVAS